MATNKKKFVAKHGLHTQNIDFVSEDAANTIKATMLDTDALSITGDAGQLFSITDSLTGTIFAVNDMSGVPSIEVDDDGTIRLGETTGNLLIGTATDDGSNKVQVAGNITVSGTVDAGNITVSGTVDGRDVAADGTKLDTIETNATADMTASEILTAVKTVDGTGSGLDADLLDGIEASGFLQTSGGTLTGSLSGTSLSLSSSASGTKFIGTAQSTTVPSTDDAKFDGFGVQGNRTTAQIYVHNQGPGGVRISSNANIGTTNGILVKDTVTDVSGNLTISGTVDGRDVAADGTKLDTIETNADVTDTASVTVAGALMDSELTNLAAVKAINQGLATTSSPTFAGATMNGNVAMNTNALVFSGATTNMQFQGTADTTDLDSRTISAAAGWSYSRYDKTVSNNPSNFDNANGLLTFNRHSGYYNTQIAMDGAGKIFTRVNNNNGFADWQELYKDNYHPNADSLTNARTITLSGDVSGSASFDGSADITITAAVGNDSHDHTHLLSDVATDTPSNALQYFQLHNNSTINPGLDWYTTLRMGHGNPSTYYNNTIAVKMTGSNPGDLFTRNTANGTAGSWNRFWHDNNDGAGSGLDADSLDGQHGSYYLDYNNFTNTPSVPSLSGYATETYVDTALSDLVDSSPATLDTLNELAAALGDDPNFATTVTTNIGTKVAKAGDTMTGDLVMGNSIKSIYGSNQALQIYYDGNARVSSNGNHDLYLQSGNDVVIRSADNLQTMAKFVQDGAAELYYDNAQKFFTTSTGAGVTGEFEVNGDRVIAEGNVLQPFNPFGTSGDIPKKVYASHLTDRFGGRSTELYVTVDGTAISDSQKKTMFNGNFSSFYNAASDGDSAIVLNINTVTNGLTGNNGFTYPSGIIKLSFYPGRHPGTTPTARWKDKDGTYRTLTVTEDYYYGSDVLGYEITGMSGNYLTDLEITITPQASGGQELWIAAIEYHGSRMGIEEGPILTTHGGTFYNDIMAKHEGTQTFKISASSGNITLSGTVDGRDVAADGTKLDGIAANATGDMTASEILTAIKTVDGAGSGLDADLLDGKDASQFLRSDQNDTISANLTIDNGVSTTLSIIADDNGQAIVRAGGGGGSGQSTGVFEVSQGGGNYGGGISYNGDNSPGFVSGESSDHTTFYRLSNGTRTRVLSYPHNSNNVDFTGNITLSGTVDGRDVAADGTKLDTIETNATADMTASEILTAIKTVDGVSSGLDADVLDGLQSTSFVRSDNNDTVSGILTFADEIRINDTANNPKIQNHSDNLAALEGMLAVPKGYVARGLSIRFDDSETDYLLDKRTGATLSVTAGTSPSTSSMKRLFGYTNYYINLNNQKDASNNFEFEVTGFSITNSSNNKWTPYVLFHSSGGNVGTVVVEGLEGDGTTWTQLFSGPGRDIIAPQTMTTFSTGVLKGLRFKFQNIAGNSYLKMVGATSTTSPSYAWPLLRNGGDIYGDISGVSDATTKWTIENATGNATFQGAVKGTTFADVTNSSYFLNPNSSGTALNVLGNITLGGTVDGRDVAADGTKLDGIAANATGDMTASEILTAVKTVDGSGSGLDADLLDGQHGSYYAIFDHVRSLGSTTFTLGAGSSTDTATLISEMENDGAFDSYTSFFKTAWSYAGNDNLNDAGNFTETAGTSWITWTDTASDVSRGNITALAIAPNTGGSAGGVFIYNDQGSSYSPGWREVWTSMTDGSGSGLDADLLDGIESTGFLRSDEDDTISGELTVFHDTFGQGLVVHRNDSTNSPSITFKNNTGQAGILYGHESSNTLIWRPGTSSDTHTVFNDNYHPNADKWTTARDITLAGDVTGTASVDGTGDVTLTATVNSHYFKSISELKAETNGYSYYSESDIIYCEDFRYTVLASGASGQHLTTTGGLKLNVLPMSDGSVHLAAFDVAGDGVTDDSAKVQVAFDFVAGNRGRKLIGQPGATYKMTSTITGTGHFALDGRESAFRWDANVKGIQIYATEPTVKSLGGNYSVGDLAINLSGNALPTAPSEGDIGYILSTAVDPANRDSGSDVNKYRTGEYFIVGANSTTTNIVLTRPLKYSKGISPTSVSGEEAIVDSYTTSNDTRVMILSDDKVYISNVEMSHQDGNQASWDKTVLNIIGYTGGLIDNYKSIRSYGAQLRNRGTYNLHIRNCSFANGENNTALGQIGYGISDGGFGTIIDGIAGSDNRHVYTTNSNKIENDPADPTSFKSGLGYYDFAGAGRLCGAKITNGVATGGINGNWDTHHDADGIVFNNVYSENSNTYSLTLRGRDLVANTVTSKNTKHGVNIFTEYASGQTDDDLYVAGKTATDFTSATLSGLTIDCDESALVVNHAVLDIGGINNYRAKDHTALYNKGGMTRFAGTHRYVASPGSVSHSHTGVFTLEDPNSNAVEAYGAGTKMIVEAGAYLEIDVTSASATAPAAFYIDSNSAVTVRGEVKILLPSGGTVGNTNRVTVEGNGKVTISISGAADTVLVGDGSYDALSIESDLFIGTTSTTLQTSGSDEGLTYREGSFLTVARAEGAVAYFNRQTTAGTLVVFRQDGATAGTIQSHDRGSSVYDISVNLSGDNDQYIRGLGGSKSIQFGTNGTTRMTLDTNGNLTLGGTVDGRDVAADGTKLDTIETNADVTDTANVTAAGALMDSELTNIAAVKAINQGLTTTADVTFNDVNISADMFVGSTSTSLHTTTTDEGLSYRDGMFLTVARAEGAVAYFNRQTTAGTLVVFRQDGENAGAIKTIDRGSNVYDVSLSLSGDNNQYIQGLGGADSIQFGTAGSTRMTLNSVGDLTLAGTVDGRDIATDGTKLDGIEADATADQTASEILTAIKTVDGAGSGLDADTLDGIEASGFLQTSGGTLTGSLSGTSLSLSSSASGTKFIGTAQSTTVPATDDAKFDGFGVQGNRTTAQIYVHNQGPGGVRISSNANIGTTNGILVKDTVTDVSGNLTISGTVDGRDVAADGTKLDTIETNADATDATNVTAAGALMDSELTDLAAVKAINQGLTTTADVTFGSATLAKDAIIDTHIMLGELSGTTPVYASTSSVEGMSYKSGGSLNVARNSDPVANFNRIGATPNGEIVQLKVDGTVIGSLESVFSTNTRLTFDNAGNQYIQGKTSNNRMVIYNNGAEQFRIEPSDHTITGDVSVTGTLTDGTSDDRLKTRLGNIENAVDKVLLLQGFYYKNNDLAKEWGLTDERAQIGLSAQTVAEVVPEVVRDAPINKKMEDADFDADFKTVQYQKLVPLLIEAIKEQAASISELKAEIQKLKEK